MKVLIHVFSLVAISLLFSIPASAKDLIWREVFSNPIEKNLTAVISDKGHLVVAGIGNGRVQQNVNLSNSPLSPNWKNWKNFNFKNTDQITVNKTLDNSFQLSGIANERLFWSALNDNGRFIKPKKGVASDSIVDLTAAETLPPRKRLVGLAANGNLVSSSQKKEKYKNWKVIESSFSIPGSIATLTNPGTKEQIFAGTSANGVSVITWKPSSGFSEKTTISGRNIASVHLGLTKNGMWEAYGIDTNGSLWRSRQLASGKWKRWENTIPLAVRDLIVTQDSNGKRTLFVLTLSDRIYVVQQSGPNKWGKHSEVPSNGFIKEISVAERSNNTFELVILDQDNFLWHTQFDLDTDSGAIAAYAQGPRYPGCSEYLPYNQYTDTWTNRFHMMAATPGSKTQLYYFTGGLIEESFAYSMFLDVTGGLSLAGCRPSRSIMGALESMGDATNSYDQYGRITTQTGNYSGSSYTMQFTYNNYGFIESVQRNGDTCVEATYDVMQRVNNVTIHGTGACSDLFTNKQTILFGYLSTLSPVPNFAHATSYKDDVPIIIASGDFVYRGSNFIVDIGVEYEVIDSDNTFNLFSFDVSTQTSNNVLQISEVEGRWDGVPVRLNQFFYDTNKYGFQDVLTNGVNLEITTADSQVNYVLFGLGPIGLNYALTYE
ncbi:MAG: hypothetical protein K6L76_00365 [Agarilytica sp.]